MCSPQAVVPSGNICLHWCGPVHRLQGSICSSAWTTTSPSSFSVFSVCTAVSHTFPLNCHCLCGILHLLPHFPWGTTIFVEGLSCVLWGICWSQLGPSVQPRADPGLSSQRVPCRSPLPTPCLICQIQSKVCDWLCRFFIIYADGSGTELLRNRDVHKYLAEAYSDPTAAVLRDPVQELPRRKILFLFRQTNSSNYKGGVRISYSYLDRKFWNVFLHVEMCPHFWQWSMGKRSLWKALESRELFEWHCEVISEQTTCNSLPKQLPNALIHLSWKSLYCITIFSEDNDTVILTLVWLLEGINICYEEAGKIWLK